MNQNLKSILIYTIPLLFFVFLHCKNQEQKKIPERKLQRITVIPFINSDNPKNNSFGNLLTSSTILVLNLSQSFKFLDDDFEKYFIYHSMQIAQKIGDSRFEKLLKELIKIHAKENPSTDSYIGGYYFQKGNKTYIKIKFRLDMEKNYEFQVESNEKPAELIHDFSLTVLNHLEPENLEAAKNIDIWFQLTNNYESLKFYLLGREEKRKKTIYGYINAIRYFQSSLELDGLFLLALNEIIHTTTQISTDLLELKKLEKIINDSELISQVNVQLRRNADVLQKSITVFNKAKKERPDDYRRINAIYERSPYIKQFELKSSLFKNQMELLLLRWEDEKFKNDSFVKGQIVGINKLYTPLLVTEFFQTLTNSKININDIFRAILQYTKEHPENRNYIHYFKNFTRLMKTMNELDFMKLNEEANFSYHQLHQEYIMYIREYMKVMRSGL